MIDSEFHFRIGGVKYRAAEDAEGNHYHRTTPTLRAPNTQLVQGASDGKINPSPDQVLWLVDDWSGGEAGLKFTNQDPGRSSIIQGLNFFGRPGDVFLGYEPDLVLNSGGGTFTSEVGLFVARDQLYAMGIGAGNDDYYIWDGSTGFGAAISTSTTDGARSPLAMHGDNNYFFFVKHGTDDLWRWDGTSYILLNNQTNGDVDCQIVTLGDYVYKYDKDGNIYELSKVTINLSTAETPILDITADGDSIQFARRRIVAGDNRIYVMSVHRSETVLYEIIPTSAAQTGFGRELKRFPGMIGESLWFHGGFLYWTGRDFEADGSVGARRVVYYLQPGASFGSLGELRSFDLSQRVAGGLVMTGASRLNTWAIVGVGTYKGVTPDDAELSLWEVDAISGGFGVVGTDPGLGEHQEPTSVVAFKNDVFATVKDQATGNTHRIVRWDASQYNTSGLAISPAHDFGLASTKVLQSIEVVTEPLPPSTSVTVGYSLDGGSFTDLSAISGSGTTGGKIIVSTDSDPKTFRSMRIRVTLLGVGSTPIVKSIGVRASSNETFKAWQLLLDVTDETSPRGHSGASLISHLDDLNNDTVVAFHDGYKDRTPGVYSEHDVVVESKDLNLSHPGEGVYSIVLREVV